VQNFTPLAATCADGGFDGDVYVSLQSQWGDVEEVKLEPATVASPDAAPAVEAAAKVRLSFTIHHFKSAMLSVLTSSECLLS
jgi:hypothetical protein